MRDTILTTLFLAAMSSACNAQSTATATSASGNCGDVISIETHDNTTTRYALAYPPAKTGPAGRIALVLLAGGGGHLDLDDQGCPRALKGNSLVRSIPNFHQAGFITALVDARSDYPGDDGLAGFRSARQHALDIGKVINDLRTRTRAPVWLIGTSRGAISALNAASRLSGSSAPDGIVLTSALMSGTSGAKKAYVAQTVFDLPLEAIRMPVLVVGHAADKCIRSPSSLMNRIIERTQGVRQQVVVVTGGPGYEGSPGLNACEGRAPHGFIEQEDEVATGIARFIRGGEY